MHRLIERAVYGQKAPASGLDAGIPTLYEGQAHPGGRFRNKNAPQHSLAYGGGADAIDTVGNCVDLYAQTASNAEWHLESNGQRLSDDAEERKTNPDVGRALPPADLVELFRSPNPFMDYTELWELAVIDFLTTGEFFWLKYKMNAAGKPLALYRMPPCLVEVEPGKGFIDHYIYNAPGAKPLTLDPSEVVHVKRPNPHDPYRGLGIIANNPRLYDVSIALTEAIASYYESGTRLSGVLESDRTVQPSTFQKIKSQFRNLYSGKANAYSVATLERGLKFRPISNTATEADYKDLSNLTKERIAAAFRVPLPLAGEMAGADRQAVREAQRIFDNKTMRPFLNRLQSQVTHQLTSAWGVDFKIDYEYVMPIEDRLDLAQALALLPGVRVREIMEQVGLGPRGIEWIDELILNLPGQNRDKGGHPDQPLGPEAGRPPVPGNTEPFPNDPSQIPASADVVDGRTTQQKALAIAATLAAAREELAARG